MAFELNDCTFSGPAIPEPFAKFELDRYLKKAGLYPKTTGEEGKALKSFWDTYRRKLRRLGERGGGVRVLNHVIEPLVSALGYHELERQQDVSTREGMEDGGWLMSTKDGKAQLRVWTLEVEDDLDAPTKRGYAYRFSPNRIAQRVLLAKNERMGLLSDGLELRILICDPARPDSYIGIRLDRSGGWRSAFNIPDSFLLLLSLASPDGLQKIVDLTDQARLTQTRVTTKLREQAKNAIRLFVQELLDHPSNREKLKEYGECQDLAKELWREGLIVVYRLLFVLKLEASPDPARAFSFASTSLWRNSFSPNTALARHARAVLDKGAETGSLLESGLRVLFRLFSEGMASSELKVSPMGGMLFGDGSTQLIDSLAWGERAVAKLLDQLLWTPVGGKMERQRVHYGPLDVEDLGRVYEALLELEPGIATEPMCRLKRQKLEVVVPITQGEPYRNDSTSGDDAPKKAKKTKVEWVEEIHKGRFYLRVGLGRKSTGSYYTPHAFVRFLVQETLEPQVNARSPDLDPQPGEILKLKVLDPAMGSGHFLVEACRFLGDKLYEACRKCDEEALIAEEQAARAKSESKKQELLSRALELRKRVEDLPDPDDEMLKYLPSRAPEGEASGLSQKKAEAIARRLIAVHCLYGVDKNPLAVELAKLSLWLESYAEGLPLTFMDHRLICGDSLTGPFFEQLLTRPSSGAPIEGLFAQELESRLTDALDQALLNVKQLENSVAKDVGDVELKRVSKQRLDEVLHSFITLAKVWSGGVLMGNESDDGGYETILLKAVIDKQDIDSILSSNKKLSNMAERGEKATPFDIVFPEVFYPDGRAGSRRGFNVVLGNPPWEKPHQELQSFFSAFDPRVLEAESKSEWVGISDALLNSHPEIEKAFLEWKRQIDTVNCYVNLHISLAQKAVGLSDSGHVDTYLAFLSRSNDLCMQFGSYGMVVGGGISKNPAARSVRHLNMVRNTPIWLLHFDNTNELFGDIPKIVEFCIVVSKKKQPSRKDEFSIGLHLVNYVDADSMPELEKHNWKSIEHILANPNAQLTFSEIRKKDSPFSFVSDNASGNDLWSFITGKLGPFVQELNSSSEKGVDTIKLEEEGEDPRSTSIRETMFRNKTVVLLNSRSIREYNGYPKNKLGGWSPVPTKCVMFKSKKAKIAAGNCRFYRVAFRRKCGSPKTNERSMRACIIPWALCCIDGILTESEPEKHPNWQRLFVIGGLNSFTVDGLLRPKVQVMLSKAILSDTIAPNVHPSAIPFIVHSSLRLSAIGEDYRILWNEQLGTNWREHNGSKFIWPAIIDDDTHWTVRSAIDAVFAKAYGLSRDQYQTILSTFSHKSYPMAPELCLAMFDELNSIGLEAFCKRYDPYWDIPLVEKLPEPVIDLPIPENNAEKSEAVRGRKGKKQLSLVDASPRKPRKK